mmetsp:Transcript_2116/g.3039  ORF Transcript_2116/g.3039 Transcript_2116/m.3039 type:complete len:117 (+) Transcript_2116:148-498(+)
MEEGVSVEEELNILTQCGGVKILAEVLDNKGRTPLHHFIARDLDFNDPEFDYTGDVIDNACLVINKSIQLQNGGKYAIGGIFNLEPKSNKEGEQPQGAKGVKEQMYDNWDNWQCFF